jgi:hypothetical protein
VIVWRIDQRRTGSPAADRVLAFDLLRLALTWTNLLAEAAAANIERANKHARLRMERHHEGRLEPTAAAV